MLRVIRIIKSYVIKWMQYVSLFYTNLDIRLSIQSTIYLFIEQIPITTILHKTTLVLQLIRVGHFQADSCVEMRILIN